jgi:branched-chain amino acid transport system permease protein
VGAYVNGLLLTKFGISPWLNLPIAAVFAGVLAYLISALTLRFGLTEDYFAMFTVAVSQVIKYVFLNWDWAGRATGIYNTGIRDDPINMVFVDRQPYLLIALAILLFIVILNYSLQRSRLGFFFAAVRENAQAAEALGINESKTKTIAIVVAGALGGLVGAFYCQYATFIDPNQVFSLAKNFEMLLGTVLGGRTTLLGPILGTSLIKPVQDLLRGFLGGEADALYLVIYGGVLIVGILFMPRGIAKYVQIWHARTLGRRS